MQYTRKWCKFKQLHYIMQKKIKLIHDTPLTAVPTRLNDACDGVITSLASPNDVDHYSLTPRARSLYRSFVQLQLLSIRTDLFNSFLFTYS